MGLRRGESSDCDWLLRTVYAEDGKTGLEITVEELP